MEHLRIWTFFVAFFLATQSTFAQGTGRVFVNTTVTSYNRNDQTGNLNVFLVLQGSRTEPVTVTCQQIEQGTGYSQLSFPSVTIPTTSQSSSLQFGITEAGRSVSVTCFGQSVGVTCPSPAQFCPETSRSEALTLVVHPAPTVSVCDSGPILADSTGSFTVRFSPTVTSIRGPVTVTCSGATVPGETLIDLFMPAVTRLSTEAFTVSYRVNQRGTAVEVSCTAQSTTSNQFLTATSRGGSAILTFNFGALYLYPRVTTVYETSFKVFLVRDPQFTSSAPQLQCAAVRFDSLASALGELESPQCSSNQSEITTTLPTTISTSTTTTTPTPTTTSIPTTTSTDPNATTATTTATTTQPSTTPPTTTPATPPPVLTSGWLIKEPSFSLEEGLVYRQLEVSRELSVIQAVQEFLVVRCCIVQGGTTFNSTAVTALRVADLQPIFCSDCTGGPADAPLDAARVVQNPAYRELAPCPCDLHYPTCDINCCCDANCTETDKLLFEFCIPGRAGGLPGPAPFYMCDSQPGVERPDWFLVLCTHTTASGYLGLFQLDTPGLTLLTAINSRLALQPVFYSYREDESRTINVGPAQVGYDSDVEVISTSHQGRQGVMSLPQTSGMGQCLLAAPIKFLQDSSATCETQVTAESCTADPLLSANSYAESEIARDGSCPSAFYFLQQYGVENATIGPSFVSYYCPTDLSDYVKSTSESYSQVAGPTTNSSLDPVLVGENCSTPCSNPVCLAANPPFSPSTPSQSPLCSWSTAYTRPSPPSLSGGVCQNAVLGARYVFTWLGQTLVRLDASVFVGDLPLGSALSQRFSVEFRHRTSNPNLTDNFLNSAEPYQRSGKPGYDYGKPVWSGCEQINQTTQQFLYVDTNSSHQMGLWNPGKDGLCANAQRLPLTFGDDTLSTCALRLTLGDFDDCNALRLLLYNHLNSLLPSDLLGRLGYNDATNRGYWVNVLRDSINVTFEDPLLENATEAYRGSCTNVVSGIKLLIMVAETGKTNGYPINEIVGARVSYDQSNWTLSCMGSSAFRCLNDTGYAEPFLLTTAAQFIKVPATTPDAVIRFYTFRDPANCTTDSCYRFYEDFSTETCHYEICWWELAYPLTSSYTSDSQVYVLGFTMVTILASIGYYCLSRPWF